MSNSKSIYNFEVSECIYNFMGKATYLHNLEVKVYT